MGANANSGKTIRRRTGERKGWPTVGTRVRPEEKALMDRVVEAMGYGSRGDYLLEVLRRDLALRQSRAA
jgi:hypothetical protein